MSDGVGVRNLLPDPKTGATSKWVVPSSRDMRVQMLSGNRLHLTNNANNADSYAYTQMALPAGTYRFGVEVSNPQGAPAARGDPTTHGTGAGHMGRSCGPRGHATQHTAHGRHARVPRHGRAERQLRRLGQAAVRHDGGGLPEYARARYCVVRL